MLIKAPSKPADDITVHATQHEPQSVWASLARQAGGGSLLADRSLWSTGATWLDGDRGYVPVRIEIRPRHGED